jgi:hypothetical protein
MIIEGSKQNYGMYPNSQGISQGFGWNLDNFIRQKV